MKLLRASRGLANPVAGLVVVHSIVFAGGLAAIILRHVSGQRRPREFQLGSGPDRLRLDRERRVLVARQNQRRRHSLVEERNPGAAIARMMWTSALLSPFVSSKALLKGANRLGYGVDVVANAEGLSFWRGGRKIVELGAIPWSSLPVRGAVPCPGVRRVAPSRIGSLRVRFQPHTRVTHHSLPRERNGWGRHRPTDARTTTRQFLKRP